MDQKNFILTKIKVKKYVDKNNCSGECKDKRRTFTKKQGDAIWDIAPINASFDPDVFRIDMFGCLVIKNIRYDKTQINRIFAYDLEHVVSYSANGITDVKNGALLNSGINRSKGDVPFYEINYNEYVGLVYRFGINPENLLRELKDDLPFTRQKYDLLFKKVDGIWTIPKKSLERIQCEVYKDNNDNTDFFPKNIKTNIKIEDQYELIVATGGIALVHIVADKTIELCLVGYNHVYYKARETLGYEDIHKNIELSYLQKILKNTGAIIITIGAVILVAALKSQYDDKTEEES